MVERGTGNEGGRVENSEVLGEVVEALVGMGYSREEARVAVKDLSPKDKDVSTLLKKALRLLSN
jgi:Holliday junction resolvasome RuvABC DNA-binding subunit